MLFLTLLQLAKSCSDYEALLPSGTVVQCLAHYPDCYKCRITEPANHVKNGGFEPPTPAGTDGNYIPEWTVDCASPDVLTDNPAEGSQYIELESPQPCTISQAIDVIPKLNYLLTYAYRPFPGTNSPTSRLEVYVNSAEPVQIQDLSGVGDPPWQYYSYEFNSTQSSATLTFAGMGNSLFQGPHLDDIRVVPLLGNTTYSVEYCFYPQSSCPLYTTTKRRYPDRYQPISDSIPTSTCLAIMKQQQLEPLFCFDNS